MDYFFEQRKYALSQMMSSNLDFLPHLHDQIELGYILSGSSSITVDNKEYPLVCGDFFIIFPTQIHSYDNSKDINGYITIFSPDILPEFKEIFSGYVPVTPVLHNNEELKKLMKILYRTTDNPKEFQRGMLLAICSVVFKYMDLQQLNKYNIDTLKSVLIYIDENFTEPIDIETVARKLHISRSHLSHIFRDRLNTTFMKYLTDKRIGFACELLKKDGITVTEAAFNSGFGSIRTFDRLFTKQIGISPRKYKANSGCKKGGVFTPPL